MRTILIVMLAAAPLFGAAFVRSGGFTESAGRTSTPAAASKTPDLELLQNPGFETGALPPWYCDGYWVADTIYPRSGIYAAHVVGNHWLGQNITPIHGSRITSITFWTRQTDPAGTLQAYAFYYSDSTVGNFSHSPTHEWARYDITASLNRTKYLVGIRLWGYYCGGPAPDSTYLDDISIQVPDPVHDVAVTELIHPRDTVELDTIHIPLARVANLGDQAETFPVVMRLEDICGRDDVYEDTVELTLSPGDTQVVEFAPWRPTYPALHRARCWTALPGDTSNANDTIWHWFWVQYNVGTAEQPAQAGPGFGLSVAPTVGRSFRFSSVSERLTIHDASGAVVREWRRGERGVVSLVWQAEDRQGRSVAPGVYFACAGGRSARLVVAR